MARLNYVELPAADVAATRDFYAAAFGWDFTDFGPGYAATTTDDTDLGIDGAATGARTAPLPVIEVGELETAQARVIAAGGEICVPIFDFPGGRRFHFRDVAGHELAVWQRVGE